MLIASLVLHQPKEIGVEVTQKEVNFECKTLAYIGIIMTILGLVMVTILHYRKKKSVKRHRFSTAMKIMLFISDGQNYIPIKLSKAAGSIHLFKIKGMLKAENIRLNKNYIWDTLEIDWREVTVTFNEDNINFQRVITIKDKIKIR